MSLSFDPLHHNAQNQLTANHRHLYPLNKLPWGRNQDPEGRENKTHAGFLRTCVTCINCRDQTNTNRRHLAMIAEQPPECILWTLGKAHAIWALRALPLSAKQILVPACGGAAAAIPARWGTRGATLRVKVALLEAVKGWAARGVSRSACCEFGSAGCMRWGQDWRRLQCCKQSVCACAPKWPCVCCLDGGVEGCI